MTATVTVSRTTARITRRHTWRTGDCSSWAIRTPVCSVSGPTGSTFTSGTIVIATGRLPARHHYRVSRGRSAGDLLALLGGQFALEDLARGRHRDGVDEHDVAQPLVRRHLVVDRGHHRVGGQRCAYVVRRPDDVGDRQLPGLVVGPSDHRRAGHPGHPEEELLQLAREHVVAL